MERVSEGIKMWWSPLFGSTLLSESREKEYARARERCYGKQGTRRESGQRAGGCREGRLGRRGETWQASVPGLLVSTASQDPLAQKPVSPGSRNDRLEVRAQRREKWVGLGGGGAAGVQSECCPHLWEDWEAGAAARPHPFQPRVTLQQDHLPSLFILSCVSLPPRALPLLTHLGAISDSSLVLSTPTHNPLWVPCSICFLSSSPILHSCCPLSAALVSSLDTLWLPALSCPHPPCVCQEDLSNTKT